MHHEWFNLIKIDCFWVSRFPFILYSAIFSQFWSFATQTFLWLPHLIFLDESCCLDNDLKYYHFSVHVYVDMIVSKWRFSNSHIASTNRIHGVLDLCLYYHPWCLKRKKRLLGEDNKTDMLKSKKTLKFLRYISYGLYAV